ncbi:MAG: RNA polymerase sigma factor [Polyangiaceae bacterium]|jgi:RNA polymerase sigma factor (sigma-70 family)
MTKTADQDKPTTSPLADRIQDDASDSALARAAVQGDGRALESLVRRHQSFIYSLAQRMLYAPEDAADATQEILLNIVTNLASYRGKSTFRTWAYRIAVRQLLAFKKGRVEHVVHDFDCFGRTLDATPDLDPPDEGSLPVDVRLVIEEAKIGCLMAMLLCLDRDHRMAFVLGEIFEASDAVAAAVLGISQDNARQRLARARQQLRQFLTGRCGLIDPAGTCQCARKTAGFVRQGIVDPNRLRFTDVHLDRTKTEAPARARELQGYVEGVYAGLLRSQPMAVTADFAAVLRRMLERPEVRQTLDVEN